jgi:hypothetical protein
MSHWTQRVTEQEMQGVSTLGTNTKQNTCVVLPEIKRTHRNTDQTKLRTTQQAAQ